MKEWFVEKLLERVVRKLNQNQFSAEYFSSRKSLIDAVLKSVPSGSTVGLGGSVTVRELGIGEYLKERGCTVYDHWQEGLSEEERSTIRKKQLSCQVFISGANAITENGEIVNMDGIGNRVASMIYGPERVIIIAGYNKIVKNLKNAIERIRTISAPMNAKRLNLPLPCAETGYCTDCESEKRICRILTVLERKPSHTDIRVFLIREEIGF